MFLYGALSMFFTTILPEIRDHRIYKIGQQRLNASNRPIYAFETANVDWCEENFAISPNIAEFFNTISNAPFLFLGVTAMWLFRSYTMQVGWSVNVVFALYFVAGVGSIYFHSTLSRLGQMIDQFSIIWVVLGGFTVWYPKRYLPSWFNGDRLLFQKMVMIPLTIIITAASLLKPETNAFVLMILAAPIIAVLADEFRSNEDWHVRSLSIRCAIEWFFAVVLWINDKLLCDIIFHHFPYLHAGWHILISISAYHVCVLFSHFDVAREHRHLKPQLRYWPKEGGNWDLVCIPYVVVREASASVT